MNLQNSDCFEELKRFLKNNPFQLLLVWPAN